MNRPALALGVALSLVAAPAAAWEPISSSRPVWSGPVHFSLNDRGSDDLDFATVETEVRRGMEDWTGVACTSLATQYDGTTSNTPRGGDGDFVIGWVESGWGHSSNAIGVTGSRFTSGSIVEADMEMNGVHFSWTTAPGSGSNVNVYSIALHEGGHYMGLGHSADPGASMYYAYSGGVSSIGSDDEAGICALYPGSGGSAGDCSTTGCPSGEECVAGACTPIGGGSGSSGGDVCAPCSSSGTCGGSGDICLGYPDGEGYCGSACGGDADCDSGDRCLTLSNGARQCVRYAGGEPSCAGGGGSTGPECSSDSDCDAGERCDGSGSCVATSGGGAGVGESCSAHEDCDTGACMGGVCTQTCDWPGGGCPSGFYCDGGATGACGPGVCMAGTQGAGAVGASCSGPTECDSLYCFDGRCAEPCVPGQVGACADGSICAVGDLSCRGACGTAGSLGDPCVGNGDCASGLCASRDGSGFCTALCDTSSPCGAGFACTTEGAVSVCVPDGGALGETCADNGDCASGICAREDERSYCTRMCDATAPCAGQMACVESGTVGVSVCQPQTATNPEGLGRPARLTGTCSVGGGRRTLPGWLIAAGGLLALARRRRS